MNKFRIILIIISLLVIGLGTADIAQAGTSLDLGVAGVGARPLGMGKAYVAVSDDANAVFTNPAGLGLQKRWALTSMSTQLYGSANYVLAGAAIPVDFGTFGIGYIGLHTPAGYNVDDNNVVGEAIDYNSSEIIISYARNLKESVHGSNLGDLSVGASLKIINKKFGGFEGSAQGTSLDLGIMYKPSENLSLGANLANVAGKVKWKSDKEEEVENTNKFGAALKLLDGKLLASGGLDFSVNTKRPATLHGGLEYKPVNFLSVRGGIDQDPLNANETETNLTLGVGVKLEGVSFDYAYRPDKNIESNARHYFSLSVELQPQKSMAQKEKEDNLSMLPKADDEKAILSYYK